MLTYPMHYAKQLQEQKAPKKSTKEQIDEIIQIQISEGKFKGKSMKDAVQNTSYIQFLESKAPNHYIYQTYLKLKPLIELRN